MSDLRVSYIVRCIDAASGVMGNITAKTGALIKQVQGSAVMREKLDGAANAAIKLGAGMAATGAGMIAATVKPIEAFAEMERAATNLDLAFSEKGAEKYLASVQRQAVELGVALEGTANDYAGAAVSMFRKGLDPKVIAEGGLKAMSHLAVLLEMNKSRAGELGSELAHAWNISGEQFVPFADLLQKGAGLGVDPEAFKYFSSQMAPSLRSLRQLEGGQGFDVSRAALAIAADLMQKAEDPASAGVGMKQIFENLALMGGKMAHGRGWKVAGAESMMQKYDIKADFFDQAGRFKGVENFLVWVDETRRKFGDNVQAFSQFMQAAFGGEAARVLGGLSVDGFNKQLDRIANRSNIDQLMEKRTKSLTSLWKQVTGTIDMSLGRLAEPIGPDVKNLLKWVQDMAAGVEAWSKQHPGLTRAIMLTTIGVGMLLVLVGGLTMGIGLLGKGLLAGVTGFSDWKALILMSRQALVGATPATGLFAGGMGAATRSVWAFTSSLLANPVTWIVVGIVGAAFLIYKYWGPLKELFKDVGLGAEEGNAHLSRSLDGLTSAFDRTCNSASNLLSDLFTIPAAANSAAEGTDQLAEHMTSGQMAGWALAQILKVVASILTIIAGVVEGLIKAFVTLWDVGTGAIGSILNFFTETKWSEKNGELWDWVHARNDDRWHGKNYWDDLKEIWSPSEKAESPARRGNRAGAPGRKMPFGGLMSAHREERPWNDLKEIWTPSEKAEAPAKRGDRAGAPGRKLPLGGLMSAHSEESPLPAPRDVLAAEAGAPLGSEELPKMPSYLAALKAQGGGGSKIEINYNPKLEVHGSVSNADKAWFQEQLRQHKETLIQIYREAQERGRRWNTQLEGAH